MALAFREQSTDYVAAEEAAKAAGVCMWRGEFETPWDWLDEERYGGRGPPPVRVASFDGRSAARAPGRQECRYCNRSATASRPACPHMPSLAPDEPLTPSPPIWAPSAVMIGRPPSNRAMPCTKAMAPGLFSGLP